MILKNNFVYLLFRMINSKFNIGEDDYQVYRQYRKKFRVDHTQNRAIVKMDYSSSKYINSIYIKQVDKNWLLCADTKTKSLGSSYIIESSEKLNSILATLFQSNYVLEIKTPFGGGYCIKRFETTLKRQLAKKEIEENNIPIDEIQEFFAVFQDINEKANLQTGFITECHVGDPTAFYTTGGILHTYTDFYSTDVFMTDLLGFIIGTKRSEEVELEINHLKDKLKSLHSNYNIKVHNTVYNYIYIVVGQTYNKSISEL